LLIAGDGPELSALRAQAESLGVADFVRFLGLRNDVPDILADVDLFSLASRAEGLTLAVMEAMVAGLSVVVTDVGGHKEVVGPAIGWVVPPNDIPAFRFALSEALANPDATRARGTAGRRLAVSEFALETQVDAQYRTVAEVLRRAKTGLPTAVAKQEKAS